MSKGRDRTMFRRPGEKWVNKCNDSPRATGVHWTQREALEEARRNLENDHSSRLAITGKDGRIRGKGTVPPGNDPPARHGTLRPAPPGRETGGRRVVLTSVTSIPCPADAGTGAGRACTPTRDGTHGPPLLR